MPQLIPLRLKERINRIAGRAVFDLSWYLQFEPSTIERTGVKVKHHGGPVAKGARRRVALVTPHLGPGGAERVLLEAAQSFDRTETELFLIAADSRDSRWAKVWRPHVDHIDELAAGGRFEEVASALYSLVVNHAMDGLLLQNTLYGYVVLPSLREALPGLRIMDVVHAVGGPWDLATATASVSDATDIRVVISEAARKHLLRLGVPEDRIRLIPNGVDLERFHPAPPPEDGVFRVLYAARLDPVKRPLMLPGIAAELRRLQPGREFRFIIAGDGPLLSDLRTAVTAAGLDRCFEFRGFVEDPAPLMAGCDVLLLTSSHEGIPLTILESFASGRPVVAPDVGAIGEVLNSSTGVLVADRNRPAAYAGALCELMADAGRRRQMGVTARELAGQLYDRRRVQEAYRGLWRPVERSPKAFSAAT